VVESVLREAIRGVLGDAWGDVPGVDLPTLEKRRVEEGKRRNDAVVDEDLLAYTRLSRAGEARFSREVVALAAA
jgi:hypothetical protein